LYSNPIKSPPDNFFNTEVLFISEKLVSPIWHTNFLCNLVTSKRLCNNVSNSVEQQLLLPTNFLNRFKKQLLPFIPAPIKQNILWIG